MRQPERFICSGNTTAAVKIKASSIEMEAADITIRGPANQSAVNITAATDVIGVAFTQDAHSRRR